MRGNSCGVLALVAVASLTIPVVCQVSASQTAATANSRISPPARLSYMAEYKIQRVQTLASGTSITHESKVITARDAQGRQMTATKVSPTSAAKEPIIHFQVFDPMDHITFTWSFPGQKVTRMAVPFYGAIQSSCGFAVARVQSLDCATGATKETVEELGTKTIQGVEARGSRTSWTTPAEYIGKHKGHKPQVCATEVNTIELWKAIAPGLTGLVVRQVSENAYSGKMSKELVKFSQGEPDAAVFRPPSDYEIVNREVNTDPCISFEGMEPSAASNPALPRSPEQ